MSKEQSSRVDRRLTAAHERIEELERKVASRDADVVSLTNQRDYEYVRAENAEQERDQLREQVAKAFEAVRVAGVEEAAVIADTRITIRG